MKLTIGSKHGDHRVSIIGSLIVTRTDGISKINQRLKGSFVVPRGDTMGLQEGDPRWD